MAKCELERICVLEAIEKSPWGLCGNIHDPWQNKDCGAHYVLPGSE